MDIYQVLQDLNIDYRKVDHPAIFTVEESKKYQLNIKAGETKNLFLRDSKGKTHYLVTVVADKRVDLKKLATSLGEKKLSFASENRLGEYLGLKPGAVSPFGLINDINHQVKVVVDSDLLQEDYLGYHPNINTATLVIGVEDFKKFLASTSNEVIYLAL